jgi:4-oxalocrotonate tautomerase
MPFVNVRMLEGRSLDQKRDLAKAITDAMETICNAKPEGTMVVIEEVPRENWARGGVLLSDQ